MATSFFYPNMIVQFQYLSQKTTANPAVGRGMIKLLKPLHFARIGVRTSYGVNSPQMEEWDDECYQTSSSGEFICRDEEKVRNLLDTSPLTSDLAPELRETMLLRKAMLLREAIKKIPDERRPRLLETLEPKHISRMWDIAGYNNTDSAADFLPQRKESTPLLPEYWRAKAKNKIIGLSTITRLFVGNTWNIFKMAFFRGDDELLYGIIFPGKVIKRARKHSCPLYFIVKNANGVMLAEKTCHSDTEFGEGVQLHELPQRLQNRGKSHTRNDAKRVRPLDFGVENGNEIPMSAKKYDLVFEFGNLERQLREVPKTFPKPAKHPQLIDQRIYIRCAGPDVLVGEAWGEGEESWGKILLIKDCTITP